MWWHLSYGSVKGHLQKTIQLKKTTFMHFDHSFFLVILSLQIKVTIGRWALSAHRSTSVQLVDLVCSTFCLLLG